MKKESRVRDLDEKPAKKRIFLKTSHKTLATLGRKRKRK